jgi:hypothetical protein
MSKARGYHAGAQKAAGLTKPRVFRSADDPNETIILMDYKELKKAKEFSTSADLKKTMMDAGVVDQPTISRRRRPHTYALGKSRFVDLEAI